MARRPALLALPLVAALAACGAAPEEAPKAEGPDPCKVASTDLAARLGPEFDKVVTGRRLPLPAPSTGGCALVYLQVDEEFAGEVAEEGGGIAVVDQLLAIALPDGRGKPSLTLVGASAMAPGPALITLDSADVDDDGAPELIVDERSGDYHGLRIFAYQAGSPEAQEIFADHLKVKTPEDLEIAARWGKGSYEGAKAIVLDGAGSKKVYTWNRAAKRFTFNEVATQATRPKPAAPESAAPGSAPAGEKKAEGLPGLNL
ncbi:MAG: hypothetical protein H6706_29205 [Myxococcales bacterium]|nr:hypothetical protein [Myxococcales bacterium]